MTNTQLINTNPSKAYRTLITTAAQDAQFCALRNEYPLPCAPTSADFAEADKYALRKMFGA